ncbi:MAG: NrpR regulatory domain-containing protein, partial [Candidatus Hinthialibacter sp.]
ITHQGYEEIRTALVTERVGFVASKVDELACQITLDPVMRTGLIVLNITSFDTFHLSKAVQEIIPVFEANLGVGRYVAFAREGERLGGYCVPPGKAAIGTICSVTINGVLLSARVPTVSRFGGVLEIHENRPVRFTDVIYYSGTSLDPLEIFIKGKLTHVREAAKTGHGRIGASFREIPTAALNQVERIRKQLDEIGLGEIMTIGKPNQSLLEFPVEEGRTGMIVTGGMNPAAAVEEAGIPTRNYALSTLYEFEKLIHYSKLERFIS